MDAELKAKWVEALRSGKYRQCQEKLHVYRTNKYCCLGVLARICTDHSTKQLAEGISGWERLGSLDDFQGEKLASMNDSGKSFAEIADYIEKNL